MSMAKRGRKPRDPKLNKTAVLSARISVNLRKRLDAAASESGRSLSAEIETLLWKALDRCDPFVYSDVKTYKIAQRQEGDDLKWLHISSEIRP